MDNLWSAFRNSDQIDQECENPAINCRYPCYALKRKSKRVRKAIVKSKRNINSLPFSSLLLVPHQRNAKTTNLNSISLPRKVSPAQPTPEGNENKNPPQHPKKQSHPFFLLGSFPSTQFTSFSLTGHTTTNESTPRHLCATPSSQRTPDDQNRHQAQKGWGSPPAIPCQQTPPTGSQ